MPLYRANGQTHYFAHIPKCGGSTLEAHLEDRFGELGLFGSPPDSSISLQHLPWTDVDRYFPHAWIESSFAVVRHPVNRFVSGFNMRIATEGGTFPQGLTLEDFLTWVEDRVDSQPSLLDNHLRPQTDFVGPDTTIFHFEEGLSAVVEYLDALHGPCPTAAELAHITHRSPHAEASLTAGPLPSPETAERIRLLYNEDFQKFGFDPTPADGVRPLTLGSHKSRLTRNVWRARTGFATGLRQVTKRKAIL